MSVGGLERIAFAGISVQDVTETEPMHGWSDRAIARDAQVKEGVEKLGCMLTLFFFINRDLPVIALSIMFHCFTENKVVPRCFILFFFWYLLKINVL